MPVNLDIYIRPSRFLLAYLILLHALLMVALLYLAANWQLALLPQILLAMAVLGAFLWAFYRNFSSSSIKSIRYLVLHPVNTSPILAR